MSSNEVFLGFSGVQGSFKAIGASVSISLSVIFAHSDNLCGIFILSRKSNTQSINELNEASFNSFLDWVLDLREKIKIPHKLSDCAKITDKDIEKLAPMALNDPCTPENPKKTSLDDMKLMYQHSLEGKLF